jgi:hypothetical protein
MNPDDYELIGRIRQATRGATRILSTLARRGKAIARDEPQRAAELISAVSTHPLYKGGRLAFDMLELEDLMLDDLSIGITTISELLQIVGAATPPRLADALMQLGTRGESGSSAPAPTASYHSTPGSAQAPGEVIELPRMRLGPEPSNGTEAYGTGDGAKAWPELASADYLYDFVVLGLLDVLSREASASGNTFDVHENGQ